MLAAECPLRAWLQLPWRPYSTQPARFSFTCAVSVRGSSPPYRSQTFRTSARNGTRRASSSGRVPSLLPDLPTGGPVIIDADDVQMFALPPSSGRSGPKACPTTRRQYARVIFGVRGQLGPIEGATIRQIGSTFTMRASGATVRIGIDSRNCRPHELDFQLL